MPKTVRFGVSMDAELLAAFDTLLARKGYANRSEAIRDLARDALIKTEWETGSKPTVAVLCLVYDHRAGDLASRLTAAQHDHTSHITATLHVHLDAHNCLEVLVLRGPPSRLRNLADRLIATRGVKHGQLVMTTTGKTLP
jgi:CopG family nickel-responsive transcriptional regulator